MKFSKLVFLFIIMNFYSCSSDIYIIKKYTTSFEKINEFIISKSLKEGNVFRIVKKNHFAIFKKAVKDSKLCSINHFPKLGIVYKFQCNNNSKDNFIDSDDKFYLIKILDEEAILLEYPQFLDYCKRPIKLNDNWFLIEQNITYD